jgi:hypothetical protein
MRDGFDCCGNLEAAEVCTAEHIAGVRGRRDEANMDRNSSV